MIFHLVGHCAYTIENFEGFFENVLLLFCCGLLFQNFTKNQLFFEEKPKHKKFREILQFQSQSKANLKEIGQKNHIQYCEETCRCGVNAIDIPWVRKRFTRKEDFPFTF